MKCKAYAKINLCLNVVKKRDDGYHELDMIMMPLELHDELDIELAKEDTYICDDINIPMDASNTVVRATELMREEFGLQEHFHIKLMKNIPAQAGLAGGSADGAAVLRGIRELCHLDISLEDLSLLGKKIGADIPFCVLQSCATVKGIGEIIEPFTFHNPYHVLLIKPKQGVSTKEAFTLLDFGKCSHSDSEKVKACLLAKEYNKLPSLLSNSLEYSAFQLVPEIKELKEQLLAYGFPIVLMSGSGSTLFALSEDREFVHKAFQHYQQRDVFVCETKFLEASL